MTRRLHAPALGLAVGMALAALAPGRAHADDEIWVWTTADGSVHYTDELERVPQAYRDAARVAHREGGGSYQRVPQAANATAAAGAAERAAALEAEARNEAAWRELAREIEARRRALADEVAACADDHVNLSHGDGSRKRRAERAEAERCATARTELAQAQTDRAALEDAARADGVPPGWIRVED